MSNPQTEKRERAKEDIEINFRLMAFGIVAILISHLFDLVYPQVGAFPFFFSVLVFLGVAYVDERKQRQHQKRVKAIQSEHP